MKSDSEVIDIIELHPKEIELIRAIRNNWRYGEVTIITRDGLPFRLKRITEFDDLQSTIKEHKIKEKSRLIF